MERNENAVLPNCCYRVSIKLLIQDDEEKYLLVKTEKGTYSFIWWGLDFDETPEQCARRETQEETWLKLSYFNNTPKLFFTTKPPHKDFYVAWVMYSAKIDNLESFIPSDECIELGYFSLEEMKSLNLGNRAKKFLDIMKEKIEWNSL